MPGKILVTGGSGFLGSHVADELTAKGYDVHLYDVDPSPYASDKQTMIVGDLSDREALGHAVKGCVAVYHFGAIAGIGEATKDPVQTAHINIIGTVNLLEACREHDVKRFVFASTVYVYSKEGAFYRASKQACEHYIETYQDEFDLPFTILRYGTLYGRRANMDNRIHAMIYNALTTGKIEHPGHGDALREFIHVKDAARLSVDILAPEYENRHLILTGQEKFRLEEAASMIAEMLPNTIDVVFRDESSEGHYKLTPYAFQPKIGNKIVPRDFVDFGQGLLDCMSELSEVTADHENDRKEVI